MGFALAEGVGEEDRQYSALYGQDIDKKPSRFSRECLEVYVDLLHVPVYVK